MQIKDRTYVVSGGASGLGRATAQHLFAEGAYVAVLDLNEESAPQVLAEIGGGQSSERLKFFQVDVSEEDSTEKAVAKTAQWAESTGKPIAGVVAAAGIGNPGKIIDREGDPLSLDSFDSVISINLRGVIDVVRQVLSIMAKNKPSDEGERGVVILVSSAAAFDGQPGQVAYSASKGAIASLTLPMARDLAPHGIRVNTIAPGTFDSAMTRMMSNKVRQSLERVLEFPKRFGQADEFATLALECIRNKMLNAAVLRLDGGVRMPSRM